MASFKNIKALEKYLNEKLQIAMDRVGETARQHMYNYIKEKLKETEPEVYIRTWEYLESIDKIKAYKTLDSSIETKIYYNTDKITPYLPSGVFNDWTGYTQDNGMSWGQHTDIYGNSIVEILPLWMEEGTKDRNGNFYPREGLGGIINLEDWVKKNFVTELKRELIKLGIPIN